MWTTASVPLESPPAGTVLESRAALVPGALRLPQSQMLEVGRLQGLLVHHQP